MERYEVGEYQPAKYLKSICLKKSSYICETRITASLKDLNKINIREIHIKRHSHKQTRMTTLIKAKLKKSDDQTHIYKYSLVANITDHYIILQN